MILATGHTAPRATLVILLMINIEQQDRHTGMSLTDDAAAIDKQKNTRSDKPNIGIDQIFRCMSQTDIEQLDQTNITYFFTAIDKTHCNIDMEVGIRHTTLPETVKTRSHKMHSITRRWVVLPK